jgi:hypothetical protein
LTISPTSALKTLLATLPTSAFNKSTILGIGASAKKRVE